MKTCFKCGRTLPLGEFYRHPQMADGHLGKCKDCARTDVSLNRLVRRDYYIQYERVRATAPHRVAARRARAKSPDGAIDRSARNLSYALRNPEKRAAQTAVGNAIRDKRLFRRPCERCGEWAQAHHDDYSQPLAVRWLCPKHHRGHHRGIEA